MITIAPLTDSKHFTVEILDEIRKAKKIYIQTKMHPFFYECPMNCECISMDDLYSDADSFEDLRERIVQRLLAEKEDLLYLYLGYPHDILSALKNQSEVRVLSGVSDAAMAFPDLRIDCFFPAAELPKAFDHQFSYCITEIDSFLRASEIKDKLSLYYQDTFELVLSEYHEDGVFKRRMIPLYELDRLGKYYPTTSIYVPSNDDLLKTDTFTIADLETIIDRLRAPDGCPWDKEQTHQSIRNDLIEESYEAVSAIDLNDIDSLCEELGDVLMHVVFHSSIGKQYDEFDLRDVISGICRKMIFRHPHVFGETVVENTDEVLKNWDKLKIEEKKYHSVAEEMNAIPKSFPALMRSKKIQKKASRVGFDWPDASSAMNKVGEEIMEVEQAFDSNNGVEEELGDLLFSVVNVIRLLHLDPEEILRNANDKFVDRFTKMEDKARVMNISLDEMTVEEQNELWDLIKKDAKTNCL